MHKILVNKNSKIFITGGYGMVGSSIYEYLSSKGYKNLSRLNKKDLNLLNQSDVDNYFRKNQYDLIIFCSAKVGGILANEELISDFLYENIIMSVNTLNASHKYDVQNFIFMGSSCIYPRNSIQPIKEDYLLDGKLEKTNEGYALAKISGLKFCEYINRMPNRNYISLMPTNLYGENDNFDINHGHVIPSLINKVYQTKQNNSKIIEMWGDGTALREFMHVDDLASAVEFLLNKNLSFDMYNIGTGEETTILGLLNKIIQIFDLKLEIKTDLSKKNGTPRKLLDTSRINDIGWMPEINLDQGLIRVIHYFIDNQK